MKISQFIVQKKQEIIGLAQSLEKDYVVTVNPQGQIASIHKNHFPTDGSVAIGRPNDNAELELDYYYWLELEREQ